MKKYVLALDQGTTSSRAIIFDKKGSIIGVAQQEFQQIFPNDGWVEHNPKEIWSTQIAMIASVLAKANISLADIDSIGITNQRETTVVWDKNTGEPVYNAIVWQDRRTAAYCDFLRNEGKAKNFLDKTGLVLDAYFSGTKVKWILDNVEGARAKAEKGDLIFGTIDTWLIWNLTNRKVHATDVSNASRTLMFNIKTGEWDDELLGILDIPKAMLPEVKKSSDDFGGVDEAILQHSNPIPIRGVAGDQQAATFGQACLKPGMAKSTYGTGCFLLMNVGKECKINDKNILTTVAWEREDRKITYALEGSVFIGGAVTQWLRDGLEIIRNSSEIEGLAASVENNGGVYLVPAFVGLGAPHWDPYARGTIMGITRDTSKAHIARAALESIAFQNLDVLRTMQDISGINLQELRVDGGASVNNLLMQFQADILQVSVVRPKVIETTALGVAYLAGLYTGFWESAEEISELWQQDKVFEPSMSSDKRDDYIANWNKSLERSKSWINS